MAATQRAYIFGGYVAEYTGAEAAPGTGSAAGAAAAGGDATGAGAGGFSRTLWDCDPASASFACDDLTLGCPRVTYEDGAFLPPALTARYGGEVIRY